MANTVFLSAREKRDSSEMALSDYSLSFSLSRYSKVEGTRKAFQILMHAAPDMQILPASDTDNVLETLECAGDIPRDGKNWEKYFFNTQTSSRRQNGTQTQQVETHATVKCSTLLTRIKGNHEVMNAMKKSGIWVKSREKGGTSTKSCIGFIMGSNPGMSSRSNLERALKDVLTHSAQVHDSEIFIESRKAKEFNPANKEVFDADAWHVYAHKAEANTIAKLLVEHLASDSVKVMSLRGCKLVPALRSITPKAVKMYRIQEQNRVAYNMTTVVVKNVYPVEIKYEEGLASLFLGYDDSELPTASTDMRTLLDYELNASMEMQEGAAWDTDYVQDIFFRQGKLNIACQSEHVKAVTQKVTLFFDDLANHLSEDELATVCGIHNYTPYKTPSIECIRNYGETGMRQVEITTSAPADIDMSLLQQLISDQQLATFAGPTQPATFNRAPKATYHARGREPVELDKSSAASATFWAEYAPPKPAPKKGGDTTTTISSFTATLPTQQSAIASQNDAIQQLAKAHASMHTEMTLLRKAASDNAKASETLQLALQTLTASTISMQAAQVSTKRDIESMHAEFTLNNESRDIQEKVRDEKLDARFDTLSRIILNHQSESPRKQRKAITQRSPANTLSPGTLTASSQPLSTQDEEMEGAEE
jgi:hypothetical protein